MPVRSPPNSWRDRLLRRCQNRAGSVHDVLWVLIAVAALLVLVVAWFAVTLVTTRMAATPTMAVFDIEEATTHVADHLPDAVTAKLSHDEVMLLLRWELTYFRERGIASFGGVDHTAEIAAMASRPVVADEDELVDELLFRAESEGLDVDAVDIVCVTDLVTDYLIAIGAVGRVVDISGAVGPADSAIGELSFGTDPEFGRGDEDEPQ